MNTISSKEEELESKRKLKEICRLSQQSLNSSESKFILPIMPQKVTIHPQEKLKYHRIM